MVTSPVSPSKFHLVIRELGAVKTKGGFAALNSGLLFLGFIFSLFLMTGIDRLIVSLSILACWISFTIYAFIKLKQEGKTEDGK
jgi:hypothetical protein